MTSPDCRRRLATSCATICSALNVVGGRDNAVPAAASTGRTIRSGSTPHTHTFANERRKDSDTRAWPSNHRNRASWSAMNISMTAAPSTPKSLSVSAAATSSKIPHDTLFVSPPTLLHPGLDRPPVRIVCAGIAPPFGSDAGSASSCALHRRVSPLGEVHRSDRRPQDVAGQGHQTPIYRLPLPLLALTFPTTARTRLRSLLRWFVMPGRTSSPTPAPVSCSVSILRFRVCAERSWFASRVADC